MDLDIDIPDREDKFYNTMKVFNVLKEQYAFADSAKGVLTYILLMRLTKIKVNKHGDILHVIENCSKERLADKLQMDYRTFSRMCTLLEQSRLLYIARPKGQQRLDHMTCTYVVFEVQ